MVILDDRGRLFGRLSLVDVTMTGLLLSLMPVISYSAALFTGRFRPEIVDVKPEQVVQASAQEMTLVVRGADQWTTIKLGDLPWQKPTFLSANMLTVQLPREIPVGRHDVQMRDYRQRVATSHEAFEVMPGPPPVLPSSGESDGGNESMPDGVAEENVAEEKAEDPSLVRLQCMFMGIRREDIPRLRADASEGPSDPRAAHVVRVVGFSNMERRRISRNDGGPNPDANMPNGSWLPCRGVPRSLYGNFWALVDLELPISSDSAMDVGVQRLLMVRDMKLMCVVTSTPTLVYEAAGSP